MSRPIVGTGSLSVLSSEKNRLFLDDTGLCLLL